ncbi:MAG: glucosyltransferase domain-containing protein [Pseudomonadota bacterium]
MLQLPAIFKLSRSEAQAFLIAGAISLIAKGAALFPFAYASDTYVRILRPGLPPTPLSQGRFGQLILRNLFEAVGLVGPLPGTLYVAVALVCFLFVGIIICRLWGITRNSCLMVSVMSIIATHPYQADIFTFGEFSFFMAVSLLLSFVAMHHAGHGMVRGVVAVGLLVAALSLYQLVLNYVLMTLIFMLIFRVIPPGAGEPVRTWKDSLQDVRLVFRLSIIVVSMACYWTIFRVSLYFFPEPLEGRTQIGGLGDLANRFREVLDTFWLILGRDEPLMPVALKVIFGGLLVTGLILVIGRFWKRNAPASALGAFGVIILIGMAFLMILGITLPLVVWWPVPRTLSAVSVFWAGTAAMVYLLLREKAQKGLLVLLTLVLFCFAGINNSVWFDQLRVNMRDREMANRIVVKLESQPSFSSSMKLAVIGGHWGYPLPIRTATGDMNISAFHSDWSKINLIREVSGYAFADCTTEDIEVAKAYCERAAAWPHKLSTAILFNNVGVVCLDH